MTFSGTLDFASFRGGGPGTSEQLPSSRDGGMPPRAAEHLVAKQNYQRGKRVRIRLPPTNNGAGCTIANVLHSNLLNRNFRKRSEEGQAKRRAAFANTKAVRCMHRRQYRSMCRLFKRSDTHLSEPNSAGEGSRGGEKALTLQISTGQARQREEALVRARGHRRNSLILDREYSCSQSISVCVHSDQQHIKRQREIVNEDISKGRGVKRWMDESEREAEVEIVQEEIVWQQGDIPLPAVHTRLKSEVQKMRIQRKNSYLIMSYNIEGAAPQTGENISSSTKLYECLLTASLKGVSVVLLQETYDEATRYYTVEIKLPGTEITKLWHIYNSGYGYKEKEKAGVATAILNNWWQCMLESTSIDKRLQWTRFDACGGPITIVNHHTPNAGKSKTERHAFFAALNKLLKSFNKYDMLVLIGDSNLRLECRMEGEENFLGPYVYGSGLDYLTTRLTQHAATVDQRLKWMDILSEHELVEMNSCFNKPSQEQITFREVGTYEGDALTPDLWNTLDHVFVNRRWKAAVHDVYSNMQVPMKSSHYPLFVRLYKAIQKCELPQQMKKNWDTNHLKDNERRLALLKEITPDLRDALIEWRDSMDQGGEMTHVNAKYDKVIEVCNTAPEKALPAPLPFVKRPWLSLETLELIQEKWKHKKYSPEWKKVAKQVKQSSRTDLRRNTKKALKSGQWEHLRHIKMGAKPKLTGLLKPDGKNVCT